MAKAETNQYDKVIKEAMRQVLPALMTDILKLPSGEFKAVHIELQRTIERKADFIGKLYASESPKLIAHLEVQAKDEPRMVAREYLYSALILNTYLDWDLVQVVFYIGKKRPTMPTSLKKTGLDFQFRLVWVKDIDYRAFLETGKPELMLLGILANYGKRTPEEVMQEVVNTVRQATKSDLDFNRLSEQLHILSNLHNLQQIFETVMLNISELIDETKDPFFKRGEKMGIEKGIEKGISMGMTEKTLDVVVNLILHSDHEDDFIANIAGSNDKAVGLIRSLISNHPYDFRERLKDIHIEQQN